MQIIYTDGTDKKFIDMCKKLDRYLYSLVGIEEQGAYDQYNTLEDIHDVVMIENQGQIVGCGSFKRFDSDAAEIKRVFVDDECRGKHVGHKIIESLTDTARQQGYSKLILETGIQMDGAVKFYAAMGFDKRDNFEPYIGMKDSVCMEKKIG